MNKKAYDLLIAVPLMAWYAVGSWRDAQRIAEHLRLIAAGRENFLGLLQLLSYAGSVAFSTLLIVVLLIRNVPRAKAEGLVPRVLAVFGTFVATGFRFMPPIALPVWLQAFVAVSITVSIILSMAVLSVLGKSFSIMAEARELKTTGPYAFVRHPLYVTESIGILALLIQFASPLAFVLTVALFLAQFARTVFEERVLEKTFPEYRDYKARTWRFIPYVI